ncbi:MAG: metal ABC transporter ATP-binding protein [Clostridiales bacterium]|nr:metal ABC transporter ATP-binding protein [Clostridiales bacterium]
MVRDITFQNVRYCYGEVCAIIGANFSLPEKQLTVLVGPNGGGKSTLIKLRAGLMKPDDGTIDIRAGVNIGYVPQSNSFDASFPLTVRDLVLQGTLPNAIKPFQRYSPSQREKAARAIQRVGLEGLESRGLSQLSGGQLKRAVIGRLLASDTSMIVLDEPDASLDVAAAKDLYAMLYKLKAEKTIVLASHNLDVALDLADHAIYVSKTVTAFPSARMLKETLKGGIQL